MNTAAKLIELHVEDFPNFRLQIDVANFSARISINKRRRKYNLVPCGQTKDAFRLNDEHSLEKAMFVDRA